MPAVDRTVPAARRDGQGPLSGFRILEIGGLGPMPFCGMLLSDLGASVLRIDKPDEKDSLETLPILRRGRRSVGLDLKSAAGIEVLLDLVDTADCLFEGYRPGVMEKLGAGPEICMERNPTLVYGRLTGWGQTGPWAHLAGHDINYLASSGALAAIGTVDRPIVPLNLVADFAAGSLYMCVGLLSALLEARRTGHGQVVDAAIVDGLAHLMTMFSGLQAEGNWSTNRGTNFIDGAAPFYNVYKCSDDQWIALGAVEPKFYRRFIALAGLPPDLVERQWRGDSWQEDKARIADAIRSRPRSHWAAEFEKHDVCGAPVLDLNEAADLHHNRVRGNRISVSGIVQGAPAPRFSRSAPVNPSPPGVVAEDSADALTDWGASADAIRKFEQQRPKQTRPVTD